MTGCSNGIQVLRRPAIVVLGIIGAFFLSHGAMLPGMVLLGIAMAKAAGVISGQCASSRRKTVCSRPGPKARPDSRPPETLSAAERKEMDAIEAYVKELERLGCDPNLAREALDEARNIVRASAGNPDTDGAERLRAFRHGLPPLTSEGPAKPVTVAERLQKELDILKATRDEVEGL